MKKADFIILIVALLLFGGAYLVMTGMSNEGGLATVSVNGTVVYELPLNQNTELTVDGFDGGYNILRIENHKVEVVSSDCPDGTCMHQKSISLNGESIVCLPHRVVITVSSNRESEVDAVAE